MKIIELRAENVKRLKAVSIRPNGNLVEITGRNGAGKTSVLDSIWWALAGATHIQAAPIRKGESEARIRLDLGTIKVTRTFKKKEEGEFTTSIVVENEDGSRFPSPQKMLDGLLGELSFDPLAFTRMEPREQLESLKRFVPGVDFKAIDAANAADYATRTDINRRAKDARARLGGISVPDHIGEPVDESALVSDLEKAGENNSQIETRRLRREQAQADIQRQRDIAAAYRKNAAELRAQAAAEESKAEEHLASVGDLEKKFAAADPLPEPIDTAELRKKIEAARAANNKIASARYAKAEHDKLKSEAEHQEKRSAELTKAMADREAAKAKAIADANLPVPGLGFGANGILLNETPFEQASDAEQLRTSIAIAIASNPKLRVIRVRDGSLLDDDAMAILAETATASDYQIWIERVDSTGRVGFVLEDGALQPNLAQAAE